MGCAIRESAVVAGKKIFSQAIDQNYDVIVGSGHLFIRKSVFLWQMNFCMSGGEVEEIDYPKF